MTDQVPVQHLRSRLLRIPLDHMFTPEIRATDAAAILRMAETARVLATNDAARHCAAEFLATADRKHMAALRGFLNHELELISNALAISFVDMRLVDAFISKAFAAELHASQDLSQLLAELAAATDSLPVPDVKRLRSLIDSSTYLALNMATTSKCLAHLLELRWDDAQSCLEPMPHTGRARAVLTDLIWISLMPTCETLVLAKRFYRPV